VIVFDNRGTGLSGKLKGLARISDFADDAAAVLSASGVRAGNPAFVFGVSMGGMIAQELVLRHPDLVRSLVLGATFASWASSDKPALHVGLRLFGIHLFGHRAKHLLAALLVSEEFEKERPADFQQWLQQAGVGKGGALMRQLGAIAGHSTLGRLHKITCPTLLVTGTRDRLVPSENSRVLEARIPGARLVELRGAGHVFPLEREDETVRLLESHFLERSVDTTGTISRRNALM
jgi:pimeloyl-ACP methyl ester carboxylesterase